jgi:hypothetical protein
MRPRSTRRALQAATLVAAALMAIGGVVSPDSSHAPI